MPEPLSYYNRFEPSKRWVAIRFRPTHGLQSPELNEMQSMLMDRSDRLGHSVYKDGHIVEGARIIPWIPNPTDPPQNELIDDSFSGGENVLLERPSLPPNNGFSVFKIEAGRIALRGTTVNIGSAFLTIPNNKYILIGVRYYQHEITEENDVSLHNPTVGTRGYGEPGASRMVEEYAWGWQNVVKAGEPDLIGDQYITQILYPVYEVLNGVVVIRDIPPESDPVLSLIAKYDRESSGNYVVRGFLTRYVDTHAGYYRFDVGAGLANILGYKVERSANTILSKAINNATTTVISEPHQYLGHLAGPPLNELNPNQDGPTITPQSNNFTTPFDAVITMGEGEIPAGANVIRYTVDGLDVTANSPIWNPAIVLHITRSTIVKARYYDSAGLPSSQSVVVYSYGNTNPGFTLYPPTISENIHLNKGPVARIIRVVGTKIKRVSVQKGALNGADELEDVTVYDILSVKQGATDYLETTSWLRVGNTVSWTPGGAEPTVGSTYEVTYSYQAEITPYSIMHTAIEVGGLMQDSEVFIDYEYSLPRKDLVYLTKEGNVLIVEGESQSRNPAAPVAATDQIALATVEYDWVTPPRVRVVAVRAIPFNEITGMQKAIQNLFDLHAIAMLKIDGRLRIAGQALGIFVDSFRDNSQRDAAHVQTAAIVRNTLMLPITGEAQAPDNTANVAEYLTLDFVLEEIVAQDQKTGCMYVNPYPPPIHPDPVVIIDPPIDPWMEPPDPEILPPGIIPPDITPIFVEPPVDVGSEDDLEIIQLRYQSPMPGGGFTHAWYVRQGREVGIHIRGARPNEHFVDVLDWH